MTNPARYDLRTLSALQTELHAPVREYDGSEYIASVFGEVFQPALRNSSFRINLTRTASNKSSVDYIVGSDIHFLLFTYLDQELPSVKVRQQYVGKVEVAWAPYVGMNLFRTASLRYGDLQPNTLTPLAMYVWMQFLIRQKRLTAVLKQVGHTPELTEWADSLPAARLKVPLPWYYSAHPSKAFPYFLLKEKKDFLHQFDFRPLEELLRVRVRTDAGGWKTVPFDEKYVELPPDFKGQLPVPELYGRACMVEDTELKTIRCEKEIKCYIDDFVFVESKAETEEGRTAVLDLDCERPCKALTFCCVSSHSLKTNNHLSFLSGADAQPMLTYCIKYGNNDRVPETEIAHADMDMWELLPPNFEPEGLALHLFDISPTPLQACSGPVFTRDQKASLCVRLLDEGSAPTARQTYKVQALLWTTHRLTFKKDERDELLYNLSLFPDPVGT